MSLRARMDPTAPVPVPGASASATTRQIVRDAAVGVGVADAPEGLSSIHHPGCAAVIWRRRIDPAMQGWLDEVPPKRLPQARLIAPVGSVSDAAYEVCASSGLADGLERAWLAHDIARLASAFAGLIGVRHVRLRVEAVSGNACTRFHVDTVEARLICTYRGTGTQYGVSPDGREPSRVFTVPTGAPVMLRGTRWIGGAPVGLLYRSPPIAGTGETRLVLVVDPIDDPEDEA